MASIGSTSCDIVRGVPPARTHRLEVWEVPGIDGVGAQKLGLGMSNWQVAAVKYGTEAVVKAWATTIQQTKGTIVTITDDWDTQHTLCLVTEVSECDLSPAIAQGVEARGEIQLQGVRT